MRNGSSRGSTRHGITAASAAYLNKGLELTAYSVRCAPASGSSSGLALDVKKKGKGGKQCLQISKRLAVA